jgi:flavin-binding protein dodecin
VTADVEVVSLAPTQPEDDVSNATSRARTSMPMVAWPESWTLRSCVARVDSWALCGTQPKSWAPHGARSKSVKHAMKELRRVRWSNHLRWQSNRQPLFHGRAGGPLASILGWSDRLG